MHKWTPRKTILRSENKIVTIDTDGSFIIIGEKINPTERKKLAAALTQGNYDYVLDRTSRQVETGADMLDVNVGVPGIDEVTVLPQVAKIISFIKDQWMFRLIFIEKRLCNLSSLVNKIGKRHSPIHIN